MKPERPSIADLEFDLALSEATPEMAGYIDELNELDAPERIDGIDFAFRILHPASATHDVFCKRCKERGHNTVLFQVRILNRPPTPRHTNIEIILAGQRGHRSEPAILIHGDGRESEVAFPEPRSRFDPYSAINLTPEDWPIPVKCHRCKRSFGRGLGKRGFYNLLKQDPPLTL